MNRKGLLFIFFSLFFFCSTSLAVDLPKVVIVHSYEKGQICGQPQDDGLVTGLAFHGYVEGISVSIERFFMDSKIGHTEPEQIAKRGRMALEFIESVQPDVVVVLDDNAIKTVMLPLVDSNIPIVFSGMNEEPEYYNRITPFMDSRKKPGHNITGVYEQLHISRSMAVMREIIPNLKKIVFLTDTSPSGRALRRQVIRETGMATNGFSNDIWEAKNFNEYKRYVKRLNADPHIGAYFPLCTRLQDNKTFVGPTEIYTWTLSNTKKPAIAANYNVTKLGFFGGVALDFQAMGKQAAAKVAQILGGWKAGHLPIEAANANALVFNQARAKQIGLVIPPDLLGAADMVYDSIVLPILIDPARILIIHSYGAESGCGKSLMESATEEFSKTSLVYGTDYTVEHFYMQTRNRYVRPEQIRIRGLAALARIEELQPDIVVTLHDNAASHVMLPLAGSQQKVLFAGIDLPLSHYNSQKQFYKKRAYPGYNISGVANVIPYDRTLQLAKIVLKDKDEIALIATVTEPWLHSLVEDLEHRFANPRHRSGFSNIHFYKIQTLAEFKELLAELAENPDIEGICLLPPVGLQKEDGSATPVQEALSWYFQHAEKPEFSFFIDMVQFGQMMAVGVDPKEAGKKLGKQIIRILSGEEPGSIPIEIVDEPHIAINLARAQQLGLYFPMEILESTSNMYKSICPWKAK